MPAIDAPAKRWLDLSEAADIIGVHFTTLRRWADAGQVPYIRTPGGRRRFTLDDLQAFMDGLRRAQTGQALAPLDAKMLDVARARLHADSAGHSEWQNRFGEEQRLKFRVSGQRLLGLLIQYGSRSDSGEAFLDEGRRLGADYGGACCEAGLSITETVRTFLFFGNSMLSSVEQAGNLQDANDMEGLRLYQRMNNFLDTILLATVESYCHTPASTVPSALENHT